MNYYIQKVRDNIFNPAYYREVFYAPVSTSWFYYLKMCLWLTLIYTALISTVFLPDLINIARQAVTDLSGAYPADLAIHLQKGTASVNLPEPIVIPMPPAEAKLFNFNSAKTGKTISNLIVIDTRTPLDLKDFDNYHTLFLLRQDAVAGDTGGEVRVNKIPPDGNVVIDKSIISAMADKIQFALYFLAPLSVLIIYLLGLVFFTATLIPILAIAFIAWLLLLLAMRGSSTRPGFKQAFGITLHAVTLSLIVNFFTFILYPSISVNFPFMVTFTLLVIYLNLIRIPKVAPIMPVAPKNIPSDTITTSAPPKPEEKPEEKKEESNTQNPV